MYITDNAYSKSTIRQMERIMLKRLNFDLGRPLPLHFLRRYSKAGEVSGCLVYETFDRLIQHNCHGTQAYFKPACGSPGKALSGMGIICRLSISAVSNDVKSF